MLNSLKTLFEKNKLLLFLILCAAQLLVIGFLIFQYERALDKGKPVIIKAEFFDPYDPFRGRYVNLYPERIELTEEQQRLAKTHPLLTAETNSKNELESVTLLKQVPQDDFYLKAPAKKRWRAQWPFSRYYMQEDLAIKADSQIVQQIRDGNVQIQFRMYKGIGVIEKVFIGNETLEEFIKKNVP